MEIGNIAGRGTPWIDDHDFHRRARLFRGRDALIQHRMRPGGVRSNKNQQIGLLQIRIAARHRVSAEGPLIAHHGGRHAEPRVGVDVRRAEKPFHELVGGVVILGKQLPGGVKRHRLRAVCIDNCAKPRGRRVERCLPVRPFAVDFRVQQPPVMAGRLAKRRAFDAQPPEVRRMVFITAHAHRAALVALRHHAAAHPAIGAGGFHTVHDACACNSSA